jgi:hypothetical protein
VMSGNSGEKPDEVCFQSRFGIENRY